MSIFTRAFNKFGGYDELAGRFPCATEPQGTRWDHQCVEFGGTMRYDWCTTLTAGKITVWQPAWDAAGPLWRAAWQTAL